MLAPLHSSSSVNSKDNYKTIVWWTSLIALSVFNISIWLWSNHTIDKTNAYQRHHLFLSGVYTFVCSYRSILPRIDLERYCLIDTQLSSMALGRAAATVAEICFSIQLALVLCAMGDAYDHNFMKVFAYVLVPAITIAQMCCWSGMLTLNHFMHAVEESIWAVASIGLALCFAAIPLLNDLSNNTDKLHFYVFSTISCIIYFIFMVVVDVPMYLNKWREDREKGVQRISHTQGGKDAWNRRVVTSDWEVWKPEVPWLTLYFSTAVWASLAFVHVSVV